MTESAKRAEVEQLRIDEGRMRNSGRISEADEIMVEISSLHKAAIEEELETVGNEIIFGEDNTALYLRGTRLEIELMENFEPVPEDEGKLREFRLRRLRLDEDLLELQINYRDEVGDMSDKLQADVQASTKQQLESVQREIARLEE